MEEQTVVQRPLSLPANQDSANEQGSPGNEKGDSGDQERQPRNDLVNYYINANPVNATHVDKCQEALYVLG